MNAFPQIFAYPIRKRRLTRTVTNVLADGRVVKLPDSAGALIEWQIPYRGLSSADLAALETFYRDAEGRRNPFTMLDPCGNLFAWSEAQDEAVWEKSPLITVTGGIAAPLSGGTAFQLSNPGGAPQSIRQSLPIPGWFTYCFTLYARSDTPVSLRLFRGALSTTRTTGPQWQRLRWTSSSESAEETVAFGVELDPGVTVDVFGFQLEGQPAPSVYRRTQEKSGVYPEARFAEDFFNAVAEGPEQNACTLRVYARS